MNGKALVILFLLYFTEGFSQAVDNTASYKNISNASFLRIHYENDFFSASDLYYTQGVLLEYMAPALSKNPISKLFISFHETKYGLAFEQNAYTPTRIQFPQILENDRPYAGGLFFRSYAISNDTTNNIRLSSSLTLGILGPAAQGYQIQSGIHGWIDGIEPLGWGNQIKNMAVINYQVDVEKQLLRLQNYFAIHATGGASVGTLKTKSSLGGVLMLGNQIPNTSPNNTQIINPKRYKIHVYGHPRLNFIAHDATLQGDIFNKTSPYTITDKNIERLTFQTDFGIVFTLKNVTLEYFQHTLTKEFKTGLFHQTGGVRMGIGL